jgi:hypothetical protein
MKSAARGQPRAEHFAEIQEHVTEHIAAVAGPLRLMDSTYASAAAPRSWPRTDGHEHDKSSRTTARTNPGCPGSRPGSRLLSGKQP